MVKLSVAVPAVVLILATTATGLGMAVSGQAAAERRRAEAQPRTGMDILNAHDCGEGETKQILVLGIEDGFSPAGSEAGFIRPGRVQSFYLPREGAGEYDQVNADRGLADSFRVEGQVSDGVFVIRSRGLGDNNNDVLQFGALGRDPAATGGAWIGDRALSGVRTPGGWSLEGDVLYGGLEDIPLRRRGGGLVPTDGPGREAVQSLRDFFNRGGDEGWLDVLISDDTAVDFMGLALCRPPPVRKGMTLTPFRPDGPERPGEVYLNCFRTPDGASRCDPYVGDTVCSVQRPVACLRPGNLPAPLYPSGRVVTNAWSGGDLAVTEPVAGDQFRTVKDVDAFCARRFGDGWRVASSHDGGRYLQVGGRGDADSVTGRVWVDIADQPHGTCWARE